MDGYMTCTHHYDFLGRFLALHQHGPEVHAALDRHVEVEGEVRLAVLVGDGASVLSLFLLRRILNK